MKVRDEIDAMAMDTQPDVLALMFHCNNCYNEMVWTPHVGVECPYCGVELFTEDGEILGF